MMLWLRVLILLMFSLIVIGDDHMETESKEVDEEDVTFETKAHHRHSYQPLVYILQRGNHNSWTKKWIPSSTRSFYPSYPMSVVDIMRSRNLGLLVDLLSATGLRQPLKQPGNFTVFAPSLNSLKSLHLDLLSITDLREVLKHHVVPQRIELKDVEGGLQFETLAGTTITIFEAKDGKLSVDGSVIDVENSDLWAENGVVHILKSPLYPYIPPMEKSNGQGSEKSGSEETNFQKREATNELLIKTEGGPVEGIHQDGVRAWLGIPFAKPPVGKLRFQPPEKADGWEETLKVKRQPNSCVQNKDETFGDFPGSQQWNHNTPISENCLFLNVYAPKIPRQDMLPVVVWIFGGGFYSGTMTLDLYNPQAFVKKGNVIFVALQYRLGPHGFLFFGKDSSAPGNVGLLDQHMALQWVQDNIENFGGDKDQVTIMGESAGGASVAFHILSPKSKGLFNRAILQSSGATNRWAFMDQDTAIQRSKKLAELLECPTEDPEQAIDCLQEKDGKTITDNEYNVEDYSINFFPFVPTVDKTFMTKEPSELLKELDESSIDLLIGNNANEGFWSLMYFSSLYPKQELSEDERTLSKEDYIKEMENVFSFYGQGIARLLAHEYQERVPGQFNRFNAIDQAAGDVDFACGTEEFAQAMTEKGSKVYRYFYNHRSSRDSFPSWSGSKHGDEIEFTFGGPVNFPEKYESNEIKLSNDIISYWLNFIKYGSPNPHKSLELWPTYQAESLSYMNLTMGHVALTGTKKMSQNCELFNDVLPYLT